MDPKTISAMYDFSNRIAVITGGAGILGREISLTLAGLGAGVAILDREKARADEVAKEIARRGGRGLSIHADVLEPESLKTAAGRVEDEFGSVDHLINAAGGNDPKATTGPDLSFFDLPKSAFRFVFDLNLLGTILPCQVFGKHMAERGEGVILNISSMNAFRPLTRIPAYSAAKAGISNFTQWLAVHMAQEYSQKFRVNAIAPGFFLTCQNRFLLLDKETGEVTPRGRKILEHTPMGRFEEPRDLLGTVLWLLSPASAFVTGAVVPIDGGFCACSGV